MTNFLFVPANVQALMVWRTPGPRDGADPYDLAPVPRTEEKLRTWYQDAANKLSPFPNERLPVLERGVHLHWALPPGVTGMRHGTDDGKADGKSPEQPSIPNRWLILRMSREKGSASICLRGWVIESDFVSPEKPKDGGTPFPFLGTLGATLSELLGTKRCGYIGRTHQLEEWCQSQNAAPYRFNLQSFAWGDPGFAAYYPACKGVLGFHDKMEDGDIQDNDLLTYLVVGWYSEAAKDPLKSGGTPERLAELGWMHPGQKAPDHPTRVLLHGAVTGLMWKDYPGKDDPETSTVAIGGSGAESIVALVAAGADATKRADLEQALCAFQNGYAQQLSSPDELDDLNHRQGFSTVPGGTRWSIVPPKRNIDPAAPPPTPVAGNIMSLLQQLNGAQRELDRKETERQSQIWRLFALWATWANDQGEPTATDRDTIEAEVTKLKNAVAVAPVAKTREVVIAGLRAVLSEALSEALKASGSSLEKSSQPPFLQPKDPFLAVNSDYFLPADTARYQRPVGKDNAPLPLRCRFVGELLKGAEKRGQIQKNWDASKFGLPEFRPKLESGLPEVIIALAREALLFDPNSTELIRVPDADVSSQEVLGLQERFDIPTEQGSGLVWMGIPPDRFAVTRWRNDDGANPWLPLYLLWRVQWTPDYKRGAEGTSNGVHGEALSGWRLDSHEVHVELKQPERTAAGDPRTFESATLLSHLSGVQLAGALKSYFEKTGPLGGIETKMLGQALGGLNEMMLRQALGLFLPPVNPLSKSTDPIEFDPIWEATDKAVQPVWPFPIGGFLPVRTGSLKLQDLLVADTFGRIRRLAGARDSNARKIIASAALPTDPLAGHHARFRPRLVQPARLNFDWIPADDRMPSAICGWIVPNFLEQSFDVFSAEGNPLGTLEIGLSDGRRAATRFSWRPNPGSTLALPGIANRLLRHFVELAEGFTVGEANAFLELVDLVARKADARVPLEDPAMAVLLGRPLALVHATLGLELHGLPAGYWDFSDSKWHFRTEEFEKLRVPVRLGGMKLPSDGLVGYWLETKEQQEPFVATWGAPRQVIAPPPDKKRFQYDQELTVNCADERIALTLLMDVGARVHATTGILPRHFIELEPDVARQAGQIKEFYVRVAPVLGQRTGDQGPAMPRPSDAFGQWSWATRPAVASDWHAIRAADDRARFDGGLTLSEGWLRLSPNRKDAT